MMRDPAGMMVGKALSRKETLMQKAASALLVTTLIVALLAGCGAIKNKGATEKLVTDYLSAVKAKEYDKTKAFFGGAFWKDITQEKWNIFIPFLNESLPMFLMKYLGSFM